MALTGAPELLLLDEPTSGVSVEETFPMMDTIVEALGDEVTVLIAQSELNHSASMLDAEIRIERGANAAG
jgi:ABC-type Mn2+/Zn2+ transport system ATPase subunit